MLDAIVEGTEKECPENDPEDLFSTQREFHTSRVEREQEAAMVGED